MRLPLGVVLGVLLATAAPAHAGWNPVHSAAKKLGAEAGTFVEATATPTIRSAEHSVRRVVQDVNRDLGKRLDQIDVIAAARVRQVDRSMEARILQVHVAVDETVDRTFGRLDQSIGRLDAVAKKRIAQIGHLGHDLITHLDLTAQKLLAEADAILAARLADVQRILEDAIHTADEAAAARIDQLDQVAGRRLGNLDVIATKQTLSIEQTLLRLAGYIAMIVLIAWALWRLFAQVSASWQVSLVTKTRRGPRVLSTAAHAAPRIVVQLALAGAGGGILYFLSGWLPHGAEARAAQQVDDERHAFEVAVASYDFDAVRYHAAQLDLLDAAHSGEYHAVAAKAELLRDVFERPARMQSLAGIGELTVQIEEVDDQLAAAGIVDPDLAVVKAYVLWQVGADRDDEHDAAMLCAQALEAPASKVRGGFLLAPLARNYLRAFLARPYEAPPGTHDDTAYLTGVLARAETAERKADAQFRVFVDYDAAVAQLDADGSDAFLDMLAAQADYAVERDARRKGQPMSDAAVDALKRRQAAAQKVVDAWATFDATIEASARLGEDPAILSVFTLDDATLAQARWFVQVPTADDFAPALGSPAAQKLDADTLVAIAPLRIAWSHRYAPLVGEEAADVLDAQESARFAALDARVHELEDAYVAYVKLQKSGAPGLADAATHAAEIAAEMGLYRRQGAARVPEAQLILGSLQVAPEVHAAIAASYNARHVRML